LEQGDLLTVPETADLLRVKPSTIRVAERSDGTPVDRAAM
jgi:hypothetical protein